MRKPFTTSLNAEMVKTLKIMSVELDCGVNDLIEAALERLFMEYNRPIPSDLPEKVRNI